MVRKPGNAAAARARPLLVGTLLGHVRVEVVLYRAHRPVGQLLLRQVEADAAQLEDCSFVFWSLEEKRFNILNREDGDASVRRPHDAGLPVQ